jgi:hypothetical protein
MAITFATQDNGSLSNAGTLLLSGTASPNQLYVLWATTGGIGSSGPYTCGFTDNVNTGSYTNIAGAQTYLSGNTQGNLLYFVTNGTGTPTLTFTTNSGTTWAITVVRYSGFVNIPSLIAPDVSIAQANSTAFNSGNFVTSQNAELCIGVADASSSVTGGNVASWNSRGGGGPFTAMYDQIGVASATSIGLNGTISGGQWIGVVQGFVDQSLVVAPPAPMYYRKNVLYFI